MRRQEDPAARVRLIDRLQHINQGVLTFALTLVAVVVIVSSLIYSVRALVLEHQSVASVVSENVGAALLFNDQTAAADMLRALQHLPNVRFSAIYDDQGQRFVYYADGAKAIPEAMDVLRESVSFQWPYVRIVHPVLHAGNNIGAILLEVGLRSLLVSLLQQALIIIAAAMMAIYLARRLLFRLSNSVLQPISGLTRLMDDVAEKSDFSLRAKPGDVEELARLADGFNDMLEQIEERDDSLAAHRHSLEREVSERTAGYLEARDLAEAASRAKSAFLSNMSHEIRTPMNAILGMANVMRREGVSASQALHLNMINTAGEHLLSLINNILDLSKIEAGKIELEQKPVNIRALVDNVSTILGVRAQDKGLALSVEIGACDVEMQGDPTRLQQCLVNYLTNAIKFSERGTIALRSRCMPQDDATVMVRFEVADQGIGIAPETIPRLFGVFEQADNSMSRRFGGSGLGLVITRYLAQLMGGEAGVESQLGVGSVFWFTARLSRRRNEEGAVQSASCATNASPEQALREQFSGKRILVVDDDEMNREVAEMTLRVTGLLVDVAENGSQAIDMASRTTYAAILMDVQMPVLDGLMATQRIRSLPEGEKTPIIAMTANAFTEDRERCLSVGMNDVLTKPFDPDHLFRILLKWMRED